MIFRLLDAPPPCAPSDTAPFNMAADEAIARLVKEGKSPPTIRFYDWGGNPALSLGSFQKLDGINISAIKGKNIPAVKRPTGGRAILHGDELTYSVSSRYEGPFKGGLFDCYGAICRAFERALKKLKIPVEVKTLRKKPIKGRSAVCFQSTSFAELSTNGKKLMGAAQKRWTDGFLQQGSIPYEIDRALHARIFSDYDSDAMAGLREVAGEFDPSSFKTLLKESFEEELEAGLIPGDFLPEELLLARELLPECRVRLT